jgi:hypothetical protein
MWTNVGGVWGVYLAVLLFAWFVNPGFGLVAVYTTLDDTSEVFDLIPMMEFLIENTTDPNRISFLVTGVYKFRVGVRRSGSMDTITSADLTLRKDGVNA